MRIARGLLLCAALCLPLVAGAQEALVDAPSALLAADEPAPSFTRIVQPPPLVEPVLAVAPAPRARVMDKKFLILTGLATAFTVVDVELTQRCLHHGTCVELNPTLPTGHAAMYLANIPATGALFYWSYRRKAKGQKLWWLPALVDLAPHVAGAMDNTRFK